MGEARGRVCLEPAAQTLTYWTAGAATPSPDNVRMAHMAFYIATGLQGNCDAKARTSIGVRGAGP